MRILTCLLGTTLMLGGLAPAATEIRFRTLCFRYQDQLKEVLAAGADAKTMLPVPLFTVYSLPATMTPTDGRAVFVLPDGKTPEGQPKYKPLASVVVPPVGEVLFLFLPAGKDAKQPYQVVALADDPHSFPWGNVRMLNLAKVPVRFHLGEYSGSKARTVKPGGVDLVSRVRKVDDFNMYNVVVEFGTPDGFVPVSNTRWKAVAGKRDLVIACLDPETRKPLVNIYKDVEPALAP
ncbi:MAG: hypothetical protein NTW21_32745 [Verrucomicrobia bacterium]|nr:hypothetical protein [Verrucomicrobiota bacterium]